MKQEHWTLMMPPDDLDLSGGGTGTPGSLPLEKPTDPPSDGSLTASGAESPFKNPALKGMTEEQIAEQMEVLKRTVAEQGTRLTRASQAPPPAAEPVKPQTPFHVDSTKFFEDPVAAMRGVVEETVSKQLRTIVDPLIADLRVQKASATIDGLRGRYSDFDVHWPYIQDQLNKYRLAPEDATEETLETLYFKSVGIAATQGRLPSRAAPPRQPPPQHAASNQPIVPDTTPKNVRDLTEGERRMARMQGFKTDAEYLEWQEKYSDQIVGV